MQGIHAPAQHRHGGRGKAVRGRAAQSRNWFAQHRSLDGKLDILCHASIRQYTQPFMYLPEKGRQTTNYDLLRSL